MSGDRSGTGRAGPVRRALLIGIDQYPNFQGAHLNGAVQDALSLAALLNRRFGFDEERIEVLTDEHATRDGIIGAFGRLLRRTNPDDTVVVHFSGHGSRRRAPDHPRRLSECENVLVPHDSSHGAVGAVAAGSFGRPSGDTQLFANRDLAGREVYAWLRHLAAKTPRITLILDCCHAGTFPRGESEFESARIRTVESDDRMGIEPLPFPWTDRDPALPSPQASGWYSDHESHTLIAACRATEVAREVVLQSPGGSAHHGALTYSLLRALERSGESTYGDLLPELTAGVTRRYCAQHPQVEGAIRRRLFSVREGRPRRDVLVTAASADHVVLGAGTIHGVGLGSRWAIYAPEARTAWAASDDSREGSDGADPPCEGHGASTESKAARLPLTEVRVRYVRGAQSDAGLLRPSDPMVVGVGCRARQVSPGLQAEASAVAVVGPSSSRPASRPAETLEITSEIEVWRARMVREIDESVMLRWVASPEEADFVVAVIGPRARPSSTDRVPGLGPLNEPYCLVTTRRGELLAPPRPLSDEAAPEIARDNLERWVRWRKFLQLETPEAASVRGQVAVEMRRRAPDDAWISAATDGRGRFRFEEGERFSIALHHRGDRDLYVYLFDLGLQGGIQPLVPSPGAHERMTAGRSLVFGEDDWSFTVPRSLPYESPGAGPWVGTQHLKLLITEEPGDFASMIQGGARGVDLSADHESSSLAEQLTLIGGGSSREVVRAIHPKTIAWSTETLSIDLRRP